jgi:hypothetical protein
MRISHRYLTFDRDKKLIHLLDKLQIPFKEVEKSFSEDVRYYGLEFFLYEDDPDFQDKLKQINKFDIFSQVGTEFSKEEAIKIKTRSQLSLPDNQALYFFFRLSRSHA